MGVVASNKQYVAEFIPSFELILLLKLSYKFHTVISRIINERGIRINGRITDNHITFLNKFKISSFSSTFLTTANSQDFPKHILNRISNLPLSVLMKKIRDESSLETTDQIDEIPYLDLLEYADYNDVPKRIARLGKLVIMNESYKYGDLNVEIGVVSAVEIKCLSEKDKLVYQLPRKGINTVILQSPNQLDWLETLSNLQELQILSINVMERQTNLPKLTVLHLYHAFEPNIITTSLRTITLEALKINGQHLKLIELQSRLTKISLVSLVLDFELLFKVIPKINILEAFKCFSKLPEELENFNQLSNLRCFKGNCFVETPIALIESTKLRKLIVFGAGTKEKHESNEKSRLTDLECKFDLLSVILENKPNILTNLKCLTVVKELREESTSKSWKELLFGSNKYKSECLTRPF